MRALSLVLALLPLACAARGEAPRMSERPAWPLFGADFPDEPAVTIDALLADPERFDGRALVVEGRVESVCAVKGCWMVLAGDADSAAQPGAESVRVRFQDYAFFVPRDAAGCTARARGTFTVEVLSIDQARHYLEDAGRHEEARALDAPVRELSFVASGVRLGPRAAALVPPDSGP